MSAGTVYRADELTQVSDVDLVESIYEHVRGLEDNQAADEFYFLLTEAFERFAPSIELDFNRARIIEGEGTSWEEALEDHIRGAAKRHAAQLTAAAGIVVKRV
jgi:hypothetical protein